MKIGKKFPFFDEDSSDNSIAQTNTKFNDISPIQMYCHGNTIFMSCKLKKKVNHSLLNEHVILKIKNNEILDEYKPFNKLIHSFKFMSIEGSHYFICCGMDFDTFTSSNNTKECLFMTSIKIFDVGVLLTKNLDNSSIQSFMIRQINILRNINDQNVFITGKNIVSGFEPIQNIISFSVSDELDKCALGLDIGQIVLIRGVPNLIECSDKNIKIKSLDKYDTELHITNLIFTKISVSDSTLNYIDILYASTTKELFYFKIYNNKEELYLLNDDTGAYSGCIDHKGDKLLIATSMDNQILEYYNLEMGPTNFFEGKKQICCYFKNYILFVVIEESTIMFAIYDKVNKFFCYHNQNYTKVLNVCTDNVESIFAFVEVNYSIKKIIKLVEKDNKYKFDIFYKRSFFDTALDYAKNLNFDKKKISDIHKKHGDHIFRKGDYQKAIEQYILTINYLDPSVVIQKFLDGSKLDYLIIYLEALHKENNFKFRSPNEMKDYTALLLNCYIKQKHIEKLKEFVDGKDISTQLVNVETAIEVCKDTDQIDLALSIADKANMFESYIMLLIDYKKNFTYAIEYMKKEGSIDKNLDILMKFGPKLLKNYPDITQRLIKDLVSQILASVKTIGHVYNYEKLIKIYINQDKYLEELLDYIMTKDNNCSKIVIHRRVEVCLDRINNGIDTSANGEKILSILKNKTYSSKYDQNYLLMLFKTRNYTSGIVALSEIMQLKQELLTIYMENHNYDKIMTICSNYGAVDNNFWVQALNYFIKIDSNSILEYVKNILDNVIENEIIPPIMILDILKSKKDMTMDAIRYYVKKIIEKEHKIMNLNKQEFDANEDKELSYNNELNDLKCKATQFSVYKCSVCNQSTSNLNVVPIVFFLCNHAYHIHCLNSDIKDDDNDSCPQCWSRGHLVKQRIIQSAERGDKNNDFRMELDLKQKKFDQIAKYLGMGLFNKKENIN